MFLNNFRYSRFIFNLTLRTWEKQYRQYKYFDKKNKKLKPTYYKVRNEVRKNIRKMSWDSKIPSMIFDTSSEDVSNSFNNYFLGISRYPKYKKKNEIKETCRYYRKNDSAFKIDGKKLKLSKTPEVTLTSNLRFNFEIKQVIISKEIDKFYASFVFDTGNVRPVKIPHKKSNICSVDLGVRTLATIYDDKGNCYECNIDEDKIDNLKEKIKHYRKLMFRKEKGSRNYEDAKIKHQKAWKKINDIRNNEMNELTSFLCKNYKNIVIEDLSVNDMIRKSRKNFNNEFRKQVYQSCMYETKSKLMYKKEMYNNNIIQVSRWYPSTQICNSCGKRNKVGRSKKYSCSCGYKEDRDVNASKNLLVEGKRILSLADAHLYFL